MRACDLSEQIPTVTRATTGAEAARIVAEYRLPGLVVLGPDERPSAVIPGSQILALVIPAYVREDPALARAVDERDADELCLRLRTHTVGSLLDSGRVAPVRPPSVLPEDTLLEIATAMVESRHPLVLVTDRDGRYHGTLLMSRVLAAIAVAAGEDGPLVRRRLESDIQRGDSWRPTEEESGEGHPS